jgi:A/G-specific adenine glycosylase
MSHDPYQIWISEIILQQTQVKQGLPYFEKFMKRFPTLSSLAEAHLDEVLKYWEGLGYYSRARNLHSTAQTLVRDYKGQFPKTAEALMKLKGIGPYTARAISSLAFGEQTAVVDGNVFRVLSRFFTDPFCIDLPAARKHYQQIADQLMGEEKAGDFNQAMMDLGAMICRPGQPDCDECPLRSACKAFKTQSQTKFPVRKPKTPKPERTALCYVIEHRGKFWMQQRDASGLWGGLFEFPWYEPSDTVPDFLSIPEWVELGKVIHVFTHFTLQLKVMYACPSKNIFPPKTLTVSLEDIDNLSLPKAMHKVLQLVRNK